MISLDEALAAFSAQLCALPAETVAIADCDGRVLTQDQFAACDLPRFDNSAMDGYALCAADIAEASVGRAISLPIAAHIAAGGEPPKPLRPGSAARILTGAPVPAGADTVIPQERATVEADMLRFDAPYPARRNIRRCGEEMLKGAPVAQAGQRVTPGLLASLTNAGIAQLSVHRRPRVSVLVSGDELRSPGATLAPGQIVDSNGPMIAAVLRRWGIAPTSVARIGDDLEEVIRELARALDEADLVISCGGASVGDHDYLTRAATALGLRQVFWKVALKPGKPTYFGLRTSREGATAALVALPGNPGAVLAGLSLHVRRALEVLEAASLPEPHWSCARLSAPEERDTQRERLPRMRLRIADDASLWLDPQPNQDSHMLGNLAHSDVLARIPAGTADCPAGEIVHWTALPGS